MNFNDKVESRLRLDTEGSKWDDGRRFVFTEKYGQTLVHTQYADWADVLWRSDTMKGETAITVIAWMDLGEDTYPSGRKVKEYYDTNELVKAISWLVENTV